MEIKGRLDYQAKMVLMENGVQKEILEHLVRLEMMEGQEDLDLMALLVLLELWSKEKRFLVLLDHLEWMEHLEYLEILVQREKWDQEGIKDSEELQEKMVCEVLLGYKEKRVELETLAFKVKMVKREIWEILARWDHQEFKVPQDYQGSQDSKVHPECLAILDHQEDKVIMVLPVQMEKMELMARWEILVPQETEENLEKMEALEFKDCQANQDQREILDHLGCQDIKDLLENKVIQEYLVQRDKEDTEGQQDPKAILENLDQLALKAHPEKLEIQVHLENRDLLGTQENEDLGVPLVSLEVQDLKDYLEWKEDLVLWVLLVHLVLLGILYQLLQQHFLGEKQVLECPDHLDPWDHLDPQGEEELLEQEDLREEEEALDLQVVPEVLEDKVFLVEQEVQGNRANQAALEEHIQKMISERYVLLF